MLELALTAPLGNLAPTVALDQAKDLMDLHRCGNRVIACVGPFERRKKLFGQGVIEIVRDAYFAGKRAELSGTSVGHVRLHP